MGNAVHPQAREPKRPQRKPAQGSKEPVCHSPFSERDKNIKTLGFACYADYLQSDLWDWIKTCLKNGSVAACECCKSTSGLAWHHREYSIPVLIGNFSNTGGDRPIVRVCAECHAAIHRSGNQWLSMPEADLRCIELCRRGRSEREEFSRDRLPYDSDTFLTPRYEPLSEGF